MMNDFNISNLIQHPEQLGRDTLYDLRSYVALYPCHQAARLLMLHNLYLLHDPTFDQELRQAAFYITHRERIYDLIEAKHHEIPTVKAEKSQGETTNTVELIDDFLGSVPVEETAKPTVYDATQDYMSYLMAKQGEQATKSETTTDLIDNFLENAGGKFVLNQDPNGYESKDYEDAPLENDTEDIPESYYTLNLAKVYIKQANYAKAKEIICLLNSNGTTKNNHYEDQIRYLDKLQKIQKIKIK